LKHLLATYNCDLYYFVVLWIYPKSMASSHVCLCALIVFNGKRHFCLAKLSMKRHIVLYMSLSFLFHSLFFFLKVLLELAFLCLSTCCTIIYLVLKTIVKNSSLWSNHELNKSWNSWKCMDIEYHLKFYHRPRHF